MAKDRNAVRKKSRGFFGRSSRARKSKTGRRLSAYVSQEHDWQAEVPNLKLSRAFGFVLALHVVAVGGILAYEIFKKDRPSPRSDVSGVVAGAAERGGLSSGVEAADVAGGMKTTNYRVVAGDSLARIAAKVGSSVREIGRINDISGGELEDGLILQVPVGGGEEKTLGRKSPRPVSRQGGGPPSVMPPVTSDRPRGASLAVSGRMAAVGDGPAPRAGTAGGKVLKARLYRPAEATLPALAASRSSSHPASVQSASSGNRAYLDHTVEKGDTLFGLSRRHGVAPGAIREANGISGDEIRIGQVIRIPRKID